MDPAPDPRARDLLDRRFSRGELKRLASALDRDPALREAVIAEAVRRGAAPPDGAAGWPGKRVLRWARGRADEAQERTTPIARDEAFVCAHCGLAVPPHGRTARDHCPRCLRSAHVDVVPGDRAAGCGGVLDPVAVEGSSAAPRIRYRCRSCGAEKVNRAALDGDPPDDWRAIVALAAGEGAP
jgi:hypothetical protein